MRPTLLMEHLVHGDDGAMSRRPRVRRRVLLPRLRPRARRDRGGAACARCPWRRGHVGRTATTCRRRRGRRSRRRTSCAPTTGRSHPETQREMATTRRRRRHVGHEPLADAVATRPRGRPARRPRGRRVMTTVQTVTGPVDAAELGRTLVHEHIRISYDGEELDPTYAWDRAETVERGRRQDGRAARRRVPHVRRPVPDRAGPRPRALRRDLVALGDAHRVHHRLLHRAPGLGAAVLLAGAIPRRSPSSTWRSSTRASPGTGGIRAGAIKAATGTEVTPRGVARASPAPRSRSTRSACAIITHTENSLHGDVQQDLFADAGADLGRVLIGHQDEQTDVAPIRKLAERGTFVGVDRIGLEIIAPDERRADHVAALVREGFTVAGVPVAGPHLRAHRAALVVLRAAGAPRRRRATGASRSRGRCGSGRTPTSSPTSCPCSSSAASPTPTSRRSSSTTRGGCSPAVDRGRLARRQERAASLRRRFA